MLRSYFDREHRQREWDVEKLRFLARLWGAEVSEPTRRTELTREAKYDVFRRLGGRVTEIH